MKIRLIQSATIAFSILVFLFGAAYPIQASPVIVPAAYAATPGTTDNRYPFLVTSGIRYEQVFAASQFSGPVLISEMDLRNGIFVSQAFSSTISNILISLSTTSAAVDGLSSTFASNVGADNLAVYSGSLTLSSANGAGPGGTHAFDISIVFQTPFLYDPGLGNLLLDVQNISGANAAIGTNYFDAINQSGDSVSRVFGPEGNPNALSGTADSLGLIVRFQTTEAATVPEPTSLVMLGPGVLGLLIARRRRNRSSGE